MIKYGEAPAVVGTFEPHQPEMMFYLYLPVKMLGSGGIAMPKRLWPYYEMVGAAMQDAASFVRLVDRYIYVTAKTMVVTADQPGNRPGWHADGFGSNGDLNYIWSDKNPTEFAVQDFGEISTDDQISMRQMTERAKPECIVTYPNYALLRLHEGVVHRVGPVIEQGVRRFIKISISRHRFANAGNSHNYLFEYEWPMVGRAATRNLDARP